MAVRQSMRLFYSVCTYPLGFPLWGSRTLPEFPHTIRTPNTKGSEWIHHRLP